MFFFLNYSHKIRPPVMCGKEELCEFACIHVCMFGIFT